MSVNNKVLKLYKSRLNLLNQMEYLGYDVTPHINFSIKEIDAMYSNDALNVLLKHTESDKKVYVEYFFQNDKKSASFVPMCTSVGDSIKALACDSVKNLGSVFSGLGTDKFLKGFELVHPRTWQN